MTTMTEHSKPYIRRRTARFKTPNWFCGCAPGTNIPWHVLIRKIIIYTTCKAVVFLVSQYKTATTPQYHSPIRLLSGKLISSRTDIQRSKFDEMQKETTRSSWTTHLHEHADKQMFNLPFVQQSQLNLGQKSNNYKNTKTREYHIINSTDDTFPTHKMGQTVCFAMCCRSFKMERCCLIRNDGRIRGVQQRPYMQYGSISKFDIQNLYTQGASPKTCKIGQQC